MRFGGIGSTELIIVLVIVLIIFGVGRLPEIGGAMGKAIREFRKTQSGEGDLKNQASPEGIEETKEGTNAKN